MQVTGQMDLPKELAKNIGVAQPISDSTQRNKNLKKKNQGKLTD